MAFDPNKYLEANSEKFDPDAYLSGAKAKNDAPKSDLGRMAQTAIESYGNTALLGNLPHIQAAAGGLVPNPGREVDEKLLKEGFTIVTPQEGYIERRDQNIKRQKEMSAENPGAALAGTVAGFAGGAALGGGAARLGKLAGIGLAPPATAFGRVGRAAGMGAGLGALSNPGDVEGEVSPLQLDERAKNAVTGAVIGGGLQVGLEGLAKGGKAVAGYFKNKAEEKAFKATGAMLKDFRKANAQERVNEIGRTLLDEGVVTALTTPGKVSQRLGNKVEAAQQSVDDLIDRYSQLLQDPKVISKLSPEAKLKLTQSLYRPLKESAALKKEFVAKYGQENLSKISAAFEEFSELGAQGRFADTDEALASIENLPGKVKQLEKMGLDEAEIEAQLNKEAKRLMRIGKPLDLAETQAQKKRLNAFIKDQVYTKAPRDRTVRDSAILARQESLRRGVEKTGDLAAELLGEDPGLIRGSNRRLGNLIQAQSIADDRVSRDAANRAIGLTDTISGGAGATIGAKFGGKPGAAIGGAVGAGLNKLGRTFGAGLQATGFDALSKLAEKSPVFLKFATENPEAFQMVAAAFASKAGGGPDLQPSSYQKMLDNPKLMQMFRDDPSLVDNVADPMLRSAIKKRLNVVRKPSGQGESAFERRLKSR